MESFVVPLCDGRIGRDMTVKGKSCIVLPSALNKVNVYSMFQQWWADKYGELKNFPKRSTFEASWRKHYPHILNPQKHNVPVCGECTSLASRLLYASDKLQRSVLKERLKKHNEVQKAERDAMEGCIREAQASDHETIVIQIDGCGNQKTMPYCGLKCKYTEKIKKFGLDLVGCITWVGHRICC
jgi:hypothetical protein